MSKARSIFEETLPEDLAANPNKAKSANAVFVFNLTGDEGGVWTLDLTRESDHVSEGESDSADCTITMTAEDFVEMWEGRLNPVTAFMANKISVLGNMGLAMKLQDIIA
jgi:putative sterol carrier protein